MDIFDLKRLLSMILSLILKFQPSGTVCMALGETERGCQVLRDSV